MPSANHSIRSIQVHPSNFSPLPPGRADEAVLDSRGRRRNDSIGGATRARFNSLPGVGQRAAKLWWDLGCRWGESCRRRVGWQRREATSMARVWQAELSFRLDVVWQHYAR